MISVQKPKLVTMLQPYSFAQALEEEYLDKVLIENEKISRIQNEELEFDGCHLKKVIFTDSLSVNFSFIDSKLEFCNCSNLSLSSKSVIRCHFLGCKFVGLDITEELIKDVVFEDCDFTLANFSNSKFQNVQFKNCLFQDTRIFACSFKDVEFVKCNLDYIEVFQSPLTGVDISTSNLGGGKFCIEDLKGAIVNSEQALRLAKLLGIVICDI